MNLRLKSEMPLLELQLFLTLQTSHLIYSTDLRSNHDLVGNMLDRLPGLKLLISFGFSSCFNTLTCSLDICKRTKNALKYFIPEKRKPLSQEEIGQPATAEEELEVGRLVS
jgi:hypothetical protein